MQKKTDRLIELISQTLPPWEAENMIFLSKHLPEFVRN